MRTINFTPSAFDEYNHWKKDNKKLQERIADLITDILRDPFDGIGKPEPLKHQLKEFWNRRINDEHRIVYQVTDAAINIISCKDHY